MKNGHPQKTPTFITSPYQIRTVNGVETAQIAIRGREVLGQPMLNFGLAYTLEQRKALGLTGLLPPAVITLEEQLERAYKQFRALPEGLSQYLFLNQLHELNEVLYYRLAAEYIEEILPVIYTPTVGQAIQEFSATFDRPRGMYLSIDDPAGIEEAFRAYGQRGGDTDVLVVTDSESILGIGDQGVGGIRIAIGKLAVYTIAAGLHPLRGIPVVLDVGTDNIDLLEDPGYLGVRHARVRGKRYNDFVDLFVAQVKQHFPKALLHWEDFGAENAHHILQKHRNRTCTFNDDIQGTAAVATAATLSAVWSKGERLSEQRVVIYGAGTAGIGIANLLRDTMVSEGLSLVEAQSRFWGLGSRGLLRPDTPMRTFQTPYARPTIDWAGWKDADPYDLLAVIRNVKPTVLIGTSAQSGAFTEEIVKEMTAHCERPIILPLSNPTSRCEAIPQDLVRWTEGRAIIATGSPFTPFVYNGTTYEFAQANNALVFPGIGLGVIAARATAVTDRMIREAAIAVARMTVDLHPGAPVLPSMRQLRKVSAVVAETVARAAEADGVASRSLKNPAQDIHGLMWFPDYPVIEAVQPLDADPRVKLVRSSVDRVSTQKR